MDLLLQNHNKFAETCNEADQRLLHTNVDLEKAFDRVPREVVWWALRYLGVDEWIVSVIKAMYEDASTKVRMNERES